MTSVAGFCHTRVRQVRKLNHAVRVEVGNDRGDQRAHADRPLSQLPPAGAGKRKQILNQFAHAPRAVLDAREIAMPAFGQRLAVLLAQACRQFEWWTGRTAPRDVMGAAAREFIQAG